MGISGDRWLWMGGALLVLFILSACVTPSTFVKSTEPTWAKVEVRSDLPYDQAWSAVVDVLVKRFDLEVLSKENGYIRSAWRYTWTGKVVENYRVRVTAKFSPDQTLCELKSEAEYGGPGKWVMGYDTELLATLKTEVMGSIGRMSP